MKTYRRLSGPLMGHRASFGRRQHLVVALLLPVLFIVAVLQWRWIGQNKQSLFRLSGSWYVERLPCELCGQMGFIPSSEDPRQRILCPVCQGRGSGYIRRVDDEDVICPACGGMGRILDEPVDAHFCVRCGGRGLIRVEGEATNAPSGTTP